MENNNHPLNLKDEKSIDEWVEEIFIPLNNLIYELISRISDIIEETK